MKLLIVIALFIGVQDQKRDQVHIHLTQGDHAAKQGPKIHTEVRIDTDGDLIKITTRKEVAPNRYDFASGTMTPKQLKSLLKAISKLWKLPVEKPKGSIDLYGMKTQIRARSGRQYWENGIPAGCIGRGPNTTKITEAHKRAFSRIIDVLLAAGKKYAKKS